MLPRILALDLDGTLLTTSNQLPPRHAQTLEQVRAMGIVPVIVTGRPLLSSRWIHRHLALDGPMICFNGIWVGVPDGQIIAQRPLPAQAVRAVVAAVAGCPAMICVYPDPDRWVVDRFLPFTSDFPQLYGVPIDQDPALVHDFQGTSCKVMVVAEPADIERILPQVKARFAGQLHLSRSQPDRIEFIALGASKAWGLEQVARHYGVDHTGVWAVGDAANDLEMLQWAGTGCAMGHAPTEVLQAARHVLPPIEEEGLAAILPLLLAARH